MHEHPALPGSPVGAPPAAAAAAPDGAIVELDMVGHSFGTTRALSELTFQVPRGRITVLLGPNGAGKTTAFRAITGALVPESGRVSTFGLDPDTDGHLVRPRCGVVSAKPALYDRLSGRDNLIYSAELYGVTGALSPIVTDAAARFGIADALDENVGGYSTGMKTRLALARSILHQPELLLFDEPTSGLDPESSHAVLELIRELTLEGRTVVMCTHLLSEAEGLADHVVMMEGGTALIAGTPGELTHRFWPNPVVFLAAEDGRLLDRVASWPGVSAYRRDPAGARLELDALSRLPEIIASLCADGARITRVDPHVPTLEDLYFAIRRQRGGSTAETDLEPGRQMLEPIRPRWGSQQATTPPMAHDTAAPITADGTATDPTAGVFASDEPDQQELTR